MASSSHHNRLINLMLSLYGVGAIILALSGLFLIPTFGWQITYQCSTTLKILQYGRSRCKSKCHARVWW